MQAKPSKNPSETGMIKDARVKQSEEALQKAGAFRFQLQDW